MLSFNDLYTKIISENSGNIITEAVKVADIREMIKKSNENLIKYKKELAKQYIAKILYLAYFEADDKNDFDMVQLLKPYKNLIETDNFIVTFIDSLSANEMHIDKMISKLADAIISKSNANVLKDDLVNILIKGSNATYLRKYFNGQYKFENDSYLNSILSIIDASNITDDDIKVFTPETFKDYTRKVKAEFSYAICLKNNEIVGVMMFDDSGKIVKVQVLKANIDIIHNYKNMLEYCDKIIAILNTYRKNIKHKSSYHEKTDDEIRNDNRARYQNILSKNKTIKRKENLKNTVESLIESIKNDLLPYKEKLTNIDIFDDDGDLAKTFLKFKHEMQILKKELQKYLDTSWINDDFDYYVMDSVKQLKLAYIRLMEMLKENEE